MILVYSAVRDGITTNNLTDSNDNDDDDNGPWRTMMTYYEYLDSLTNVPNKPAMVYHAGHGV